MAVQFHVILIGCDGLKKDKLLDCITPSLASHMPFGYIFFRAIFNIFGLILPGYSSYKAIKAEDDDLILQWTKYWIVICAVVVIESITDTLIYWFPLYYEAKTVAILWLSLPYTQGAIFVYAHYIQPLLERKEEEIDLGLARSRSIMKRASLEWSQKGVFMLKQAVLASLVTPIIDPEFVKPKLDRKPSKRLERQLSRISDQVTPEQGMDTTKWISRERDRLQKLIHELDKLSLDMGANPPPVIPPKAIKSTHARAASLDVRKQKLSDISRKPKSGESEFKPPGMQPSNQSRSAI